MPVMQQVQPIRQQVYIDYNTRNKSFLEMHYFLKSKGIKNNAFFLSLYDTDLIGVDPFNPHLTTMMKQKILRECMINYWYFLREVARIPKIGGSISEGTPFNLHRGNLAMNFLFVLNKNMFVELP